MSQKVDRDKLQQVIRAGATEKDQVRAVVENDLQIFQTYREWYHE